MSKFSYDQYQTAVSAAQNGGNTSTKVGYFKLQNDGDEALVRLNISSTNDLDFASVHTIQAGGKWLQVSCLNTFGNNADTCPLCGAVAAGNSAISKASKKVYIQMLASYRNPEDGSWSAAQPVIWARPAGFSRELATKLKDFGDLKTHVFKVTRNGAAGDMQTTYSLDYVPVFDKPELVATDLSAFDNFNIAKHSYWEKTADELKTFLTTGAFPETTTTSKTVNTPTTNTTPFTATASSAESVQTVTTPIVEPQKKAFNNFSF